MNSACIRRATGTLDAVRVLALGAAALALAACGEVEIGTDVQFPTPLVEELPMTVGVYYSDEFRKYAHDESRWGVDWKVDLGQYHVRMGDKLFESAFRDTVPVKSLSELPSADSLRAVIEPRIEQYSFITPRDTGAKYYAVTIRYRLNVFAPDGRLADSLTFTGYGSAPSSGYSSTGPMLRATRYAMRDAAAKFLVQFPEQPIAKKMIAQLPLIEEEPSVAAAAAQPAAASAGDVAIETVPIVDEGHPSASTPIRLPGTAAPQTPPSGQGPAQSSPGEVPAQPPSSQAPAEPTSGPAPAEPASGQAPVEQPPETRTTDTPGDSTPAPAPADSAPPPPPEPEPDPGSVEGPSRWTTAGTDG